MEFFTGWLFYALIACLLGIGGYFTLRFAGVQIRALPHSVAMLWKKADQEGISPFQALTVGLSTRVGTGNIIGIALAMIVTYGFVFNAVQANSIADAFQQTFGWERGLTGVALVLLSAPIVFGG